MKSLIEFRFLESNNSVINVMSVSGNADCKAIKDTNTFASYESSDTVSSDKINTF
ncbi:MAG: hypothetical protein IKP12_00800 [Acholeplasmatales bacterium]|nr:hypothetical protein [Acholeplasmatales bacterium]